ncbi:MAG: L-proline dehydrogenase [Bryobacterales bacterium]|nr:L-proline dehydrogenase [Bryobacterales bacterium]
METSRIARPLSSRFIAGLTLADALTVARSVNLQGMAVSLDHLGENVTTLAEAETCRDVYLRALVEINSGDLDANVSLKLTQFGIDLSEDACLANVGHVVRTAAKFRNFVRIDMESSEYTDRTLGMVHSLYAETKSCGAVIQAYLRRSARDLEELNRRGIRVRLCKGAYLEPAAAAAFQDKKEVDENFLALARKLLADGVYPGIATHDERMIAGTLAFVKEHKIDPSRFEFQMLYGVRRDLQKRLVAEGWRVRVYVPFGEAWFPYFMRRLAERPANLVFILRNLLRG